mgnify:CR=1 FL=1|tara:strand:+ start:14665 stop:16869 length:2205 start_codon:yes stop_codon:yes gene_type:complete
MIKLINKFFFILTLIIILAIVYLSFFGIKTNKFNDIILENILKINKNLELSLNDVNYFLNPLKLTIKISTKNPKILISDSNLDIKNIKTEASLISLIKGDFFIDDLNLSTREINIKDAISLAKLFQNSPQLFLLDNIVKEGKISVNIILNFDPEKKEIKDDYIIEGFIKKAKLNIFNQYKARDLSFAFNIVKGEYLLTNIETNFNKIRYVSEFIEIRKKNQSFLVKGNVINNLENYDFQNIKWLIGNFLNESDIKDLRFGSKNNFSFTLNKKFKLNDLKLDTNLDIKSITINKKLSFLKNYFPNYTNQINFANHKIKIEFSKNKLDIKGEGDLILNDSKDQLTYKIVKKSDQLLFDTLINIKNNPLNINILDFIKKENVESNLSLKGIKKKNKDILFELISLDENKNQIKLKNLLINKNSNIMDLELANINYTNNNKILNQLEFKRIKKQYIIEGKNFDASKIINRILDSSKSNLSLFKNFNPKIKIDLKRTYIDKDNYMNNLSGYLNFKDNKINELNLKSVFQNKKKINLSIETNNKNETTTKLFSSYPKPLVEKYDFIKGFEEGNLNFYSLKQKNKSQSVLIINNFKVKEVPVLAKLLSLASLQGISDLLTGEGIRFTDFEMSFSNEKDLIKIEEIYAIGPAISLLMSGYIEKDKLISLRGTLVPATTINKTIATIPLLGKILIGDKTGEGVFGVSFKIKGPPKDLKTTVNPIKTLTPRFITRTLEKIKKPN